MLRLVFIIGGVAALVFFALKSFDRIIGRTPNESDKVIAEKLHHEEKAIDAPLPPSLTPPGAKPPEIVSQAPKASSGIPYVESVAVHVFRNRPVPPAPFARNESTIGNSPDSRGLALSVDIGSNSWILRGPPNEVEQTKRIAELVDVMQTELDLDFILVAVSEDWLRSYGLTASYQQGASWLQSFVLDGSGATLRLESGSFAVDIGTGNSTSAARLVSAPVVRCITGEDWKFSADRQIPISSVQRSEGVVSTGYEYREIGLGFSGILQKAGPPGAYRLRMEQRNGDVDSSLEDDNGAPPVLRSQVLQSSLVVEVGRWSCVGGVTSWRVETKKRLLGSSEKESQELLLIFVRPRDALSVAPRAFPVGEGPKHLSNWGAEPWEIGPDENPLLPPLDFVSEEERQLVEEKTNAKSPWYRRIADKLKGK